MVYDSYEFGKYLMELRRKDNISMSVICEGICDVSVMSRIENGEREVSKLVQDRLLGRLGVASENFENMVFSDEYERWKIRQRIIALIQQEKIEDADVLLEKMYKDNRLAGRRQSVEDLDAILEMQFYLAMKAQIRRCKNADDKELRKLYANALRQTVVGFDKSTSVRNFLNNKRFSVEELNLLIEYGRYLPAAKGITLIRGLIEYIDNADVVKLVKAKVYPKAVYYLYESEIQKGVDDTKKIMHLIGYVTKAIEYLRDSLRSFYLYELLDIKMKLIAMCEKDAAKQWDLETYSLENDRIIDSDYMNSYGNTEKYSMREQYIWCRYAHLVLEKMYLMSGTRCDTFEYSYNYADRDVYCIEDVIRIRRNMLNISMGKLCSGICSERTISRIERKLVKPQAATVHKLFERLGLSCEFSRTELTSSDIRAQETLALIRIYLNDGNSDKVDELLEALSEYVDFDIPQNRQIILRIKACNMRMAKKISDAEFVKYVKEALECTLPYEVAVSDIEKYMSNEEISCINNILITKSSDIKEVGECYNALRSLYKSSSDMICNFLSMYEFVMQPVASYCGDCGMYDEADEIEKIIFVNTMRNRRLTVVSKVIYCLLWNNLQRQSRGIPIKNSIDKNLELKECLILNDIAKNERKYKIIGNIIQKK